MNNHSKISVLRIIDAAQNRAAEGLRAVEDCARMHKQDAFLARQLKQLRHELTAVLFPIDALALLQSRDPASDVGTQISTQTEFERPGLLDIVRSNFARVLQSLRTMEEYSKLLTTQETMADSEIPRQLEQLRYRTYTLEKALTNTLDPISQFDEGSIYVLTDARSSIEEFERLVRSFIDARVDWIQLRDKSLSDHELIQRGQRLTELTKSTATRWIMNDRADLAMLSGAEGVHVGQDDLNVHQARRLVGTEKIIGVSTHDIEQARAAELAGANYIGIGPIFPSKTKSFDAFVPTEFVTGVVNEISVAAFAIGGIDVTNIKQLAELGVSRVAVSKSIVDSENRSQTVVQLKQALGGRVL